MHFPCIFDNITRLILHFPLCLRLHYRILRKSLILLRKSFVNKKSAMIQKRYISYKKPFRRGTHTRGEVLIPGARYSYPGRGTHTRGEVLIPGGTIRMFHKNFSQVRILTQTFLETKNFPIRIVEWVIKNGIGLLGNSGRPIKPSRA